VVRPENPESKVAVQNETPIKVPPRAFVFAYEQKGWKTLSDFAKSLEEIVREIRPHIHGFAILNSDWYVQQVAYADPFPQFEMSEGASLLKFVNGMLHSLGSLPMEQMHFDRYYKGAQ
jgi:hypothetical protein